MKTGNDVSSRIFFLTLTSCLALGTNASVAQEAGETGDMLVSSAEIQALMTELREQKRALEIKEKELDNQKQLLEKKVEQLDKTLLNAENLIKEYGAKPKQQASLSIPDKKPVEEGVKPSEEIQTAQALDQMRGTGTQEVGVERKCEKQ